MVLRWMAGFSLIFVFATAIFYRLGFQDVSLIYANMINLASRIIYASHFIKGFFKDRQAVYFVRWSSSFPNITFFALPLLSRAILHLSRPKSIEGRVRITLTDLMKMDVLLYILVAVSLASACAGLWWFQTGRRLVLPRRGASS
jgi:oligosaccharide translocation protein RFT1